MPLRKVSRLACFGFVVGIPSNYYSFYRILAAIPKSLSAGLNLLFLCINICRVGLIACLSMPASNFVSYSSSFEILTFSMNNMSLFFESCLLKSTFSMLKLVFFMLFFMSFFSENFYHSCSRTHSR